MSEFQPVRTKADLDTLDDDDIVAGYMHGLNGGDEPGSDKSRSFWHGWRNGMVDSRRAEPDSAQGELARELVGIGLECVFGSFGVELH
ncbi:hypothetical protein [Achromobacter aloeverae]|uniref:Uncharacterized protein n=1 Tax=Achromobacter aloeverae TaxID=1750518 RepID=A0A4Q1HIG9_9BURK|nr:hypothetical protein [Achromobacter aloeverae]RXN87998.1 hypothetical protein C7R54_15590 [Achromobacter aloeverae]